MKAVRYYGKEDIRVEDVKEPSGPGPRQIVVIPGFADGVKEKLRAAAK